MRYVAYQDRKRVAAALKPVYGAVNADAAELALAAFDEQWGGKYPMIAQSWRDRWTYIVPFLSLPADLRRAVYTTNSIENLNRQIRKSIKTRGHFPDEQAATKLIYLAIIRSERKWLRGLQLDGSAERPQDPFRRPTPRLTPQPTTGSGLTHRSSDTLPGPEDPSKHLGIARHQQRVKPEPALCSARPPAPSRSAHRSVSRRSRGSPARGRRPAVHARARASRPRQRGSPASSNLADRKHHPPCRRHRGHLAEQRLPGPPTHPDQRRTARRRRASPPNRRTPAPAHDRRAARACPASASHKPARQPNTISDQRQQRRSPPATTTQCRPPEHLPF